MDKLSMGLFRSNNSKANVSSRNTDAGTVTGSSSSTTTNSAIPLPTHQSDIRKSQFTTTSSLQPPNSDMNNQLSVFGLGLGIGRPQNPRLSKILLASPRMATEPGFAGEAKRSEILERQLREVSIHASTAFDKVDELTTNNEMLLEQVDEQKNMIMQLLYQLKVLENESETHSNGKRASSGGNRTSSTSSESDISSKFSVSTADSSYDESSHDMQLSETVMRNEKLLNKIQLLTHENQRLSQDLSQSNFKIQELQYQLLESKQSGLTSSHEELAIVHENMHKLNQNQKTLSLINSHIKELDSDQKENLVFPLKKMTLCEKYPKPALEKLEISNDTFVINQFNLTPTPTRKTFAFAK